MSNDFKLKLQAIVEQIGSEYRSQTQKNIDSVLETGAVCDDDWLAILENRDIDVDIRKTVCWTLSRLEDKRALPSILLALKDQDSSLRSEAAIALGTLFCPEAVPHLISVLLEDETVEVRTTAAYGLGALRDTRAVEHLIHTLENQNEDPRVRGQAAEALGDIRDTRSIVPLIAALKDASVEVRFWAIFALGQLGDAQVIPELERLVATDESILPNWGTIKDEAVAAIQNIRG